MHKLLLLLLLLKQQKRNLKTTKGWSCPKPSNLTLIHPQKEILLKRSKLKVSLSPSPTPTPTPQHAHKL